MLLRALVPNGWMPNTAGTPGVPFAICTINGPVMLGGAQDPAGKHAPDGMRHMDICPFAASIRVATPPFAVFVGPLATVAFIVVPALAEQSLPSIERHSPQSPRAPPSFV